MKAWKRILALALSVSTMGMTILSSGCDMEAVLGSIGGTVSSSNSSVNSSVEEHIHVWEEKIILNPTCTEQGKKVRKCLCGEEEYQEIAPSHKLVRFNVQNATCMQEGVVKIYCENCEYRTQEIEEKKDHIYVSEIVNPKNGKRRFKHSFVYANPFMFWGEHPKYEFDGF